MVTLLYTQGVTLTKYQRQLEYITMGILFRALIDNSTFVAEKVTLYKELYYYYM